MINPFLIKIANIIKAATYAPGIFNKQDYGEPSEGLTEGDEADFVLQHHSSAKRPRSPHLDMRIGIPGKTKGLYSWAVPNAEMPEVGKKRLIVQTPEHSHEYGRFSGMLGKGPMAGKVKVVQRGKALIEKVTPNVINFKLQGAQVPVNYSLIKLNTGRKTNDWLLINRKASKDNMSQVKIVQGTDMDDVIAKAVNTQTIKEAQVHPTNPYGDYLKKYEGWRNKPYNDKYGNTSGVMTLGYGHKISKDTENILSKFMPRDHAQLVLQGKTPLDQTIGDKLLNHDIATRLPAARAQIKNFDGLPETNRIALFGEVFRGSIPQSPKSRALFNQGKFDEARKEYLNNAEFKRHAAIVAAGGNSSVYDRMQRAAGAMVGVGNFYKQKGLHNVAK